MLFNKTYCDIYQLYIIKTQTESKKSTIITLEKKFNINRRLFVILKNDLCNNLNISTRCIFSGKFILLNKKTPFSVKNLINSLSLNLITMHEKTHEKDLADQFMMITAIEACFVVINELDLNKHLYNAYLNSKYLQKIQKKTTHIQKLLFLRLNMKTDKSFLYKFILHIFIPFLKGNFFFKKALFLLLMFNQPCNNYYVKKLTFR